MALARRGFLGRLFAAVPVAVVASQAKASPAPDLDGAHLEAIQLEQTREALLHAPREQDLQRKEYLEWLQAEGRRQAEEQKKWYGDYSDYSAYNPEFRRTWTDKGSGLMDAIARTYDRGFADQYEAMRNAFYKTTNTR